MYSKFFAALLTLFVCLGIDVGQTIPTDPNDAQLQNTEITKSADSIALSSISANTAVLTEKYDLLSAEEAEAAALAHAAVRAEDAIVSRTEPDFEYGALVWDVEFRAENWEYDYTVHAGNGEILRQERDYEPQGRIESKAKPAEPSTAKPAETVIPVPQTSETETLSADAATEIALEHAGLSRTAVKGLRAKLDRDDGRTVYEIEFRDGAVEYEYEIHAQSGTILDWDRDYDD